MKKDVKTHIECVKKYEGSYYFDRNFANLVVKFNEKEAELDIFIVSYENSEQYKKLIGSAKTVKAAISIVEKSKEDVKELNKQLKSDYLQLVRVVEDTGDSNIVFDDKNVEVKVALSWDGLEVSLNINKPNWEEPILLYQGNSTKKATKAIKKAIHTGLCIQRGSESVILAVYNSLKEGK